MNYRLTIQYDGTDFHGWQLQSKGERTVQGELTRALSLLDGGAVIVHGAGRTDAGVHAEGQVASVHLRREFEPERLRNAVNGNLKRDVRVISACVAPDDFHARFSARGKTYRYRIFNAPYASPFFARYALHEARALDVDKMREAARLFIGEKDFTAFSSAQAEVETRVRNVWRLTVDEKLSFENSALIPTGARLIEITISADGFLRYMVRSIVGSLLAVARGEMTEDIITRALRKHDRRIVAATAVAKGLTLAEVLY